MFNSYSLLGLSDPVFDRVVVDHLHPGNTRVSWLLREDFPESPPLNFELQVGESGIPDASDWDKVVDDDDVAFLMDTSPRDMSISPVTHYRVKVTTSSGDIYYSRPEPCWGTMNRKLWLQACAVARREQLRLRLFASEPGWLFKRMKKTPPVTDTKVVDFLTGEVRKTKNTPGIGTDRIGGFFTPFPFYMDLSPIPRNLSRDDSRGQVDDVITQGRCLAFPQIDSADVWASATGDARYSVQKLETAAMWNNVPIIVNVQLGKLSPADPIYELPLPPVPKLHTLGRREI